MEISKNWYVMVIIIILLVAILSGYIYFTNEENSSYTEYHFELEMESDSQTEVFWPIPYDADLEGNDSYGNISDLVYDLDITDGTGTIKVNTTQYGKALEITFNETIRVEGNKIIYWSKDKDYNERDKYFFDDLSMRNKTETEQDHYFVYSSTENVRIINFDCYNENVGELDSDGIVGKGTSDLVLDKGWQSVEL